jgi:hypothetical protein
VVVPFLTREVKCGAAALDVADQQNAHSMALAVRDVVELFRLVKREKELHQEIVAFSISHDYRTVRIYGHYTVIDGPKTTFYRHLIHMLDFIGVHGKEKRTAYCGGVQWTPMQDHLLQAVVDPLWCIDIRPAWQLVI